jgi:quinohemoprotein ethanol dehydrogenase
VLAPAFTAEQLTALPSANWITNGGNAYNQRYSPLTEINRFNVKDVKAVWKTQMGSGAELKNGGQTQILHHDTKARYSSPTASTTCTRSMC